MDRTGPEQSGLPVPIVRGRGEDDCQQPHHEVAVSNIRQLDETHVPALLLLHVGLEIRREAGRRS